MGNTTHNPNRDFSSAYYSKVRNWIEIQGEVLVVMRHLYGSQSFALIHSTSDFMRLIESCPDGTDTISFKGKQLPLRGIIDEEFISKAKDLVSGSEFLCVMLEPEIHGDLKCRGCFDFSSNLTEELREYMGSKVAFGLCPDFSVADHDGMISASKGGVDGPR